MEEERRLLSQRRGVQRRRLPIVALTASAVSEIESECLLHGMDGCIFKPRGKVQMIRAINHAFTLRSSCPQRVQREYNSGIYMYSEGLCGSASQARQLPACALLRPAAGRRASAGDQKPGEEIQRACLSLSALALGSCLQAGG